MVYRYILLQKIFLFYINGNVSLSLERFIVNVLFVIYQYGSPLLFEMMRSRGQGYIKLNMIEI